MEIQAYLYTELRQLMNDHLPPDHLLSVIPFHSHTPGAAFLQLPLILDVLDLTVFTLVCNFESELSHGPPFSAFLALKYSVH